MPCPHCFTPLLFWIELIFTLVILIICLIIYFKTKESYKLTKHQGIKFFRSAFFLFGLAYAVRLIFMLPRIFLETPLFRGGFSPVSLLLLSYISTMAIFYLIFSLIWKQFNTRPLIIFGHLSAILLSIIAFVTRSHLILLYIQSLLIISSIVLIVTSHKIVKHKFLIKTIYILIFLFWLISLWNVTPGGMFIPEFKVILNLISIGLFGVIYYKISKWLK